MKILSPVGKFGTSWWGNVRPLLIISAFTITPVVLCLPLIGLFAGGLEERQTNVQSIMELLFFAVLLPVCTALFMGSWFFMWGIVIDRQLRKKSWENIKLHVTAWSLVPRLSGRTWAKRSAKNEAGLFHICNANHSRGRLCKEDINSRRMRSQYADTWGHPQIVPLNTQHSW